MEATKNNLFEDNFPSDSNYRPQRSCGKVIFSQVCVNNSFHKGGHVWRGGMRGRGACVVGGGMHGRGHAWWGGCAWGACVAGKMAIAVGGTHPTGMHSCSL